MNKNSVLRTLIRKVTFSLKGYGLIIGDEYQTMLSDDVPVANIRQAWLKVLLAQQKKYLPIAASVADRQFQLLCQRKKTPRLCR